VAFAIVNFLALIMTGYMLSAAKHITTVRIE